MTKATEKLFETRADEQIFDLKGFLRELAVLIHPAEGFSWRE
jgi:hypothetical protein